MNAGRGGFTENSDGTSSLTVNVVFPYGGVSKVYAHELVIRPLEDGGGQYVSNKIISAEDNAEQLLLSQTAYGLSDAMGQKILGCRQVRLKG